MCCYTYYHIYSNTSGMKKYINFDILLVRLFLKNIDLTDKIKNEILYCTFKTLYKKIFFFFFSVWI